MSASVLHPHGESEWADRGSDRKIVRDCLQCPHCAMHFYVGQPGIVIPNSESAKRRCAYCMNCGARTCGQPKCDPCIPWRKKFELIEAGLAGMELISTGQTHHSLPVSVSVPAAPPKGIILG